MAEKESRMANLVSKTDSSDNITIYPEKAQSLYLSFNKHKIQLENSKDLEAFVKACETFIRNSNEYKGYIAHLKSKYNLRRCSLYSHIDDSMAPIEMHHGPIFTLYDYVTVTMSHIFKTKELELSSFSVFDIVMKDHYDGLIQTIMLSEMAHAAVHPKKPGVKPEFVSIDSAFGDIVGYLNKYTGNFSRAHIAKIKNYLHEYDKRNENSERSTIFKESVKSWKDYK